MREAYKEKMSKDINNIDTYENRKKVNTTKQRPIYEVIDEAYMNSSKFFSDNFIRECMDNSNEACGIPRDVKNNIQRMAMEQGLYAQVIMIRQNYLKFVATDKNKNEAKLKFQGQSARSQRCFDLDFDCIEVNFSTRGPGFYKKLFQIHDDTQDINTFIFFQVPIGNAKCVESFKFQNDSPILKYFHKS